MIEKQEQPLCFHISSFTCSKKEEKVRPSQVKFLPLISNADKKHST